MKIGIYFGSTTGNTERIADLLSDYLQEDTSVNYIENFQQKDLDRFDLIIFGIPTWNVGELESSWEEFFPTFDKFDFTNHIVALYGVGDQANYPDTFQDAMGILYSKLIEKNAKIIGNWSTEGYIFQDSLALRDNQFVGLALDEDNQPDKTDQRLKSWIVQLKQEYSHVQKNLLISN